jgi:hypothetical protein
MFVMNDDKKKSRLTRYQFKSNKFLKTVFFCVFSPRAECARGARAPLQPADKAQPWELLCGELLFLKKQTNIILNLPIGKYIWRKYCHVHFLEA